MARITMDGIDEAIKALDMTAEQITQRAPEAVMAGAEALRRVMSANAPRRTGQLAASIRVTTGHNTADGYYADVAPDGKRADGESNSRVAFVLENGRSNMAARHWMQQAVDAAQGTVAQVMLDVLRG